MCGIAAAVGTDVDAYLRHALRRLEYRGYDSCGLAVFDGHEVAVNRHVGKPSAAFDHWPELEGGVGIAHTRWASHGPACLANTHPIEGGRLSGPRTYVVHNGIVENWQALRKILSSNGYHFQTDTDTEVIAHLLDAALHARTDPYNESLLSALEFVRSELRGTYCFAAMADSAPDYVMLVAAGSPLVVCPRFGLVASDAAALATHVSDGPEYAPVYRMPDSSVALLYEEAGQPVFYSWPFLLQESDRVTVPAASVQGQAKARGEWLLREIHEQASLPLKPMPALPALPEDVQCLTLVGSGSSYHAALYGEYLFRDVYHTKACLSVEAEPFTKDTLVIALTQSGETADLLRYLRVCMSDFKPDDRPTCFVVTNRPHSSCAALATAVIPLDCGEERSVAATKSFTAQVLRLYELCNPQWDDYLSEDRSSYFGKLAEAMRRTLRLDMSPLTGDLRPYRRIFVAGSGPAYPVALEGALKLKEVAYQHAEAVHLAEIKHGPLALLDESTLVIALVSTETDLNGLSELCARDLPVVAICEEKTVLAQKAEEIVGGPYAVFTVPSLPSPIAPLQPLLYCMVLQRLAYQLGMANAAVEDPDLPRSLAKSITVG